MLGNVNVICEEKGFGMLSSNPGQEQSFHFRTNDLSNGLNTSHALSSSIRYCLAVIGG